MGNSYYHYTAVSSLEANLISLVQVLNSSAMYCISIFHQFLGIMVATLVVCSTILYFAASINVFKVYLHIMKEYGWPFGNHFYINNYN